MMMKDRTRKNVMGEKEDGEEVRKRRTFCSQWNNIVCANSLFCLEEHSKLFSYMKESS